MAKITSHYKREANQIAIQNQDGVFSEKTITFDGGTTNAIGDHDGTGDPFDIFSVTGTVLAKIWGVCSTTLTSGGSPTLEVGVSGNTASILPQVTDATNIAANDLYIDSSVGEVGVADYSNITQNIIGNSLDVIGTVGTANITAGVITFYALWLPVSGDGNLIAA